MLLASGDLGVLILHQIRPLTAVEDELDRIGQLGTDATRPVGWLSIAQKVSTELAQEVGFQLRSAFPDTWRIGKTICTPAEVLDDEFDIGETIRTGEEKATARAAAPGAVLPDLVRPRYLKCTADVYLLKRVSGGHSDWCAEPGADGKVGCKILVDVTDGDYDAFDNTLHVRRHRRESGDHDQESEPPNKAQQQQQQQRGLRERRLEYQNSELHPNAATVQHIVYAGIGGPFVWPAGGVTFINWLQGPISVLLDRTMVDIEGLLNGETFGLATVVDAEGAVAPYSWDGAYRITMICENDILGLQDHGSNDASGSATGDTPGIQDWHFVVLREEFLVPGATGSITVTFVVTDLHTPRVFEPVTVVHTLTLVALPPAVVLHLWFDTAVPADASAVDHANTVKKLIMEDGLESFDRRFWVDIQPTWCVVCLF